MYYELLFFCLLTSCVSVGFFLASERGNLLYFLKRPVENWIDELEFERNAEISFINNDENDEINLLIKDHPCYADAGDDFPYSDDLKKVRHNIKQAQKHYSNLREVKSIYYNSQINFIINLYKPVFLCPRCMASLWSLFVYLPLCGHAYGYGYAFAYLIPAIFISALLNSILHKLAE